MPFSSQFAVPPGSLWTKLAIFWPAWERNGARNWVCWALLPERMRGVRPRPVPRMVIAVLGSMA